MSELIWTAIVFGAGLFIGWTLLPAPKVVQDWWAKVKK